MGDLKKTFLPFLLLISLIISVGLLSQNKGYLPSIGIGIGSTNKGQNLIDVTIGDISLKAIPADTEDLRKKGLSKITKLEESQGMVFIFPMENSSPIFWMKDTKIPLDIIWINDNKIVQIDKNIQPPDPSTPDDKLTLYKTSSPVDYVLEVNGGFSDKNKISTGAQVIVNY